MKKKSSTQYQATVSALLKVFCDADQKRRQQIIREQKTMSFREAADKSVFYVFKGEVDQINRVFHFLVKNKMLTTPDDYYYASTQLSQNTTLKDVELVIQLRHTYRQMGGRKHSGFSEAYFGHLGVTKSEMYAKMKKKYKFDPWKDEVLPKRLREM